MNVNVAIRNHHIRKNILDLHGLGKYQEILKNLHLRIFLCYLYFTIYVHID